MICFEISCQVRAHESHAVHREEKAELACIPIVASNTNAERGTRGPPCRSDGARQNKPGRVRADQNIAADVQHMNGRHARSSASPARTELCDRDTQAGLVHSLCRCGLVTVPPLDVFHRGDRTQIRRRPRRCPPRTTHRAVFVVRSLRDTVPEFGMSPRLSSPLPTPASFRRAR